MKKIILLLYFISGFLCAQKTDSYEITYSVYPVSHASDYNYEVKLYTNKDKSRYVINTPKQKFKIKDRFLFEIAPKNRIIEYDYKVKKIKEERGFELTKKKLFAIWIPNYSWEITKETKMIKGYKCYKAIINSLEIDPNDEHYQGKVYAWYTLEIPIPSGPKHYNGLPGLIIEMTYSRGREKITMKEIKSKNTPFIFKPLKGIHVDDPLDVIYHEHKNPAKIKKILE